jgi:hypothetical protein
MKKIMVLAVFLVIGTAVAYASGVNQKEIDSEYTAKTWADKSDWVYEFNQMANKVHNKGQEVIQYNGKYTSDVTYFDEYSYRYKTLLDRGVTLGFIDDKTRQQQLAKLRKERDDVSAVLAKSSGLGL